MLYTYHFLGMSIIGWITWCIIFTILLLIVIPTIKKNAKNTPMEMLERQLSKGEISIIEYEKRKRILEKDHDLKIREYLVSRHTQN